MILQLPNWRLLIKQLLLSCLLYMPLLVTAKTALITPFSFDQAAINDADPESHKNLWQVIGSELEISQLCEVPAVQQQIMWYQQHPATLTQLADHSKPFLFYIHQETKTRSLPLTLALIPVIESAYDPFAYSHVGAAGLWQMMPKTAGGFGVKQNWWYDGRRDLLSSTSAALDYLQRLHLLFSNDWSLAIAAYNAGEGTVQRAIKRNQARALPTDFWSLPLPRETKQYVPRLYALACMVKYYDRYHPVLPYVANRPYLSLVDLPRSMDLLQAAKLAGLPATTLYQLNPGFNRWHIDPQGPTRLLLPRSNAQQFMHQLPTLAENTNLSTHTHINNEGLRDIHALR